MLLDTVISFRIFFCTLLYSTLNQVKELLHFKDKLTAQQFQRVATRAALTIVEEHAEFAHQFLLEPLLKPLLCCASVAGMCVTLRASFQ